MKIGTSSNRARRHPVVVDLLGGSPTATARAVARSTEKRQHPKARPNPPARKQKPQKAATKKARRNSLAAVVVVGIAAVAAVWGPNLMGDQPPSDPTTDTTAATVASSEVGLPSLSLAPATSIASTAAAQPTDECRADRGDQNSGAGAIAAFNFAYYVSRDGTAARALASPTSTVQPAPDLQRFIDEVPVGTTYCVKSTPIAADNVYLVDLSVMRPNQPAERIVWTVSTVQLDGRWFVDTFT